MKDPRTKQAKVNCFFCMFVNTFEVCWFIFGMVLFFGSNNSDFNRSAHLKQTLIAIVVWGAIVTFVYMMGLCGICLLLAGMWQYGIFNSEKSKEYRQYLEKKEKKKITLDSEYQNRIKNIVQNSSSLLDKIEKENDMNGPPADNQYQRLDDVEKGMRQSKLSIIDMNIDIKDGIIVINDDIVTDFEVYKQLYNIEIKNIISEGGECSVCLLPITIE